MIGQLLTPEKPSHPAKLPLRALPYIYFKSVSGSGVLALAGCSPPQDFFPNKPCASVWAVSRLAILFLFQSKKD
jgi:hypothetical protein